MDEDMEQFMSVTGTTSERVALGYLEISGGDPMQAIQLFFENPDLQASFAAPATSAPAGLTRHADSTRSTGRTGREDAQGVIHLDSDDEADVPMTHDDLDIANDDDDAQAIARCAQEEEDAAMARRLQEEMYGENPGSADGVRAPIARRTEMLAAPDPSWSLDDDRESAVLEQLRRRRAGNTQGSRNPFNQSVWDDPDAPAAPTVTRPGAAGTSSASRRLADLFRPPHELLSHLSWDAARETGKEDKKWILVNLQDMSDFNCQALNRDHWKNENIRSLINEHFIFLQYEKGDPRADSYITFYFPNQSHEDPNNYPHVSIIDPRTGEQVKVWSGLPFPPPAELHADLVEFLDRYSLHKNSKNPVVKAKPKAKPIDYGRLTEDEMMELALKQSLETNGGGSSSNVLQDPDALTKSNPDISGSKGKERATDEPVDLTGGSTEAAGPPPPAVEQGDENESAAFQSISSTNFHTEPEHNPATTTRIQFRHSGGRVIRRFAVADPVRRLYEWLKAEPLEGKEAGVVFELKTMPAGRDLIGELDKTIEEAGLKNGTVMIEYLED
ncbi:hypothetical protein DL770_007972 [Monosporascus sp. CRB-9-2]|nr:hypothetical protein DL770_007972 [Monosporascus sp. CRB-9-2]